MALPENTNIVFNTKQLSEYFGGRISASTLNIWRTKGKGPKYFKIGSKVFYPKLDADAWWSGHLIDPSRRGR